MILHNKCPLHFLCQTGIITVIVRQSDCIYIRGALQSFQTPYYHRELPAYSTWYCHWLSWQQMNAKWKTLDRLERNLHDGTDSIQLQATAALISCRTFHSLMYITVCSHRPDVHEMDHAGVLDSQLNGYLCRSAPWSLLMTSRWSSSIFKTLFVHKGSRGNEVLVIGINEISPLRLKRGMRQEDLSWTPRPTVCAENASGKFKMCGKSFTH